MSETTEYFLQKITEALVFIDQSDGMMIGKFTYHHLTEEQRRLYRLEAEMYLNTIKLQDWNRELIKVVLLKL